MVEKFTPITVVRCMRISASYSEEQIANSIYDLTMETRKVATTGAKGFGHKVISEQINTNIVPTKHYGEEEAGYNVIITYIGVLNRKPDLRI